MNETISAIIIAIIQGITEWIPVSSKGHLILAEKILGFSGGGLFFDVALHFGTLMAVFVYFGKDITDILQDFFRGKWGTDNGKIGVYLIIATIPAGIFGFLFFDFFKSVFSELIIAAFGFGITGLLLIIASIDFGYRKELGLKESFLIGCAQIASLIPGISRSGMTISSGVLLGIEEKKALRFSFLMSIPIIFGANILVIGNNRLNSDLIWATLVSFIVGLLMIHLLYNYVLTTKRNLRWFGIYALLLAFLIAGYLIFG